MKMTVKRQILRSPSAQQTGQVFPLCLIFIGLLASLVLFFGKHAIDVNRAHHRQNLADAAAFSAATWRARVLNFNAFANRALIAQEVYAAHLTEANAWAAYAKKLAQRGQELSHLFPAAQPAAQAISQLVSVDEALLRQLSELELFARTAPGFGLNDQLEAAQTAFLRSADGFGLSAVANEVVKAADASAFAHTVAGDRFSLAWNSAVTDTTIEQDRLLAWHSLGGMTKAAGNQSNTIQELHLSAEQIAPIPTLNCVPKALKQLTSRFVRESSLSRQDSGWNSSQTLSLHGWRRGSWLPVCGLQQEQVPIAWARQSAVDGSRKEDPQTMPTDLDTPSMARRNPQAEERAKAEAFTFESYHGAGRLKRIAVDVHPSIRHPLRILVAVSLGEGDERPKSLGAAWVVHHHQQAEQSESAELWLFPNWKSVLSVPTAAERTYSKSN